MNLYLTSSDWIPFNGSKQISDIEHIKIGLSSYLLVTLTEILTFSTDKQPRNKFLLTTTFHFIGKNYINRLPLRLNVFKMDIDSNNKIKCGVLVAKGVDLHTKEQ